MSPPDLSSTEAAAAERAQFRWVAFWPRIIGLGMILGAALMLWFGRNPAHPNSALVIASYAALALGWVLVLVAIFLRSRYQRRRLSGG